MSKSPFSFVVPIFYALCHTIEFSRGEGRFIRPPSRGSMWRYGFRNPVEYGDARLDCGGFRYQWKQHGGLCGPCGDPWDERTPRKHETGGRYANNIIVANYTQGQVVEMASEVTGGSGVGWMEYRLCNRNDPKQPETNDCFSEFILQSQDGSTRFNVVVDLTLSKKGQVSHAVLLPPSVICSSCIIQWRYVTHASQRTEYRACSDVTIRAPETDDENSLLTLPTSGTITTSKTTKTSATSVNSRVTFGPTNPTGWKDLSTSVAEDTSHGKEFSVGPSPEGEGDHAQQTGGECRKGVGACGKEGTGETGEGKGERGIYGCGGQTPSPPHPTPEGYIYPPGSPVPSSTRHCPENSRSSSLDDILHFSVVSFTLLLFLIEGRF